MEDNENVKIEKIFNVPDGLRKSSQQLWGKRVLEGYIYITHGKEIDVKCPVNNELTGITGKIQIAGKEITYFLKEGKGEVQVIKKERNI